MSQYISHVRSILCIIAAIFPHSTQTSSCCPWLSTHDIAVDFSGNREGPKTNLSATILEDGDVLNYRCIQPDSTANGIGGSNRFQFKGETGDWQLRGSELTNAATGGGFRGCQDHQTFICTHVYGRIKFDSPNKAGQYMCTSLPDKPQWVYWYRKEVRGSSLHVSSEQHGGIVDLRCNMPIAPAWKSYKNMLTVTWDVQNRRSGNSWTSIDTSLSHIKVIFPERGANVTLRNTKFRPHLYGGNYRCTVAFKRDTGFPRIQSPQFSVTAEAKATLSNSLKRENFVFGIGESVTVNCSVEAYPFVDKIEINLMRGNQKVFNSDWIPYGDTIHTSQLAYHYASLLITNVTAEELNGTSLVCVGKRKKSGTDELENVCREERNIKVRLEAPRERQEQAPEPPAAKKPWVVAISVIIPIIIILMLVIVAVWWCNRESDDEDYQTEVKYDGEDDELRVERT